MPKIETQDLGHAPDYCIIFITLVPNSHLTPFVPPLPPFQSKKPLFSLNPILRLPFCALHLHFPLILVQLANLNLLYHLCYSFATLL